MSKFSLVNSIENAINTGASVAGNIVKSTPIGAALNIDNTISKVVTGVDIGKHVEDGAKIIEDGVGNIAGDVINNAGKVITGQESIGEAISNAGKEISQDITNTVSNLKNDVVPDTQGTIGYSNTGVFNTTPKMIKELIDRSTGIADGRRVNPADYYQYVRYQHRASYEIDQYHLRIGDCVFIIPPEFIQVTVTSQTEKEVALRQKNTVKTKYGYSSKEIVIVLNFNGMDQINGFSVGSPMQYNYRVDGLIPLIAQFKCTPFLPVENELLNAHYGIYNIALQTLTVTTIPGFPGCVQATLICQEFNAEPYIEMPNNYYDALIDWDLFRYYYQKFIHDNVIPITNNYIKDDFQISTLKYDAVKGKTSYPDLTDNNNYEIIVDNKTDEISISEINFTMSNILPLIQLSAQDSPTMQYMGGLDIIFNISFETTNKNAIDKIQQTIDKTMLLVRQNRALEGMGFVKFKNDFCSTSGTNFLMIEEIKSATTPGFPGLFRIDMQCISYDFTQRNRENLESFKPFNGDATYSNTINQSKDGLYTKIRQDTYAQEKMLDIELYPDLSLPTYAEADNAITAINQFRIKNGLNALNITSYPRDSTSYEKYVDPDFYVFYPLKYMDLRDDLFDTLKGPTTAVASSVVAPKQDYGAESDSGNTNYDGTLNSSGQYTASGSGSTQQFLNIALSKNGCGYIFGASGEILTDGIDASLAASYGTSGESEAARRKWLGKQVFDCSGFVSWILGQMHLFSGRTNCDGLWGMCNSVGSLGACQPGDLLMRGGEHVAIYIGNNQTIEANGVNKGTCILSALNRGWTRFGRLKCLNGSATVSASNTPQQSTSTTQQPSNTSGIHDPTDGEWPKVNKYDSIFAKYGPQYGFDPNLLKAICWVESKGDNLPPNEYGCRGIMQMGPQATAQIGMNVEDMMNPDLCVQGCARYLQYLYNANNKDLTTTIWKYNGARSYYNLVWNAYQHVGSSGSPTTNATGGSSDTVTSSINGDAGQTFNDKVYDYNNYKQNFGKPIYDKSTIMDNNFTRFANDEDYLSKSCVDMCRYNHKSRMVRAFPAYLFMILDDCDIWFEGSKFWTNYYIYKSVVNISVNQDKSNAIDTATIKVTNTYNNLNKAPKTKDIITALMNDNEINGVSKFLYKYFGTMFTVPHITLDMLKIKNQLFDTIYMDTGVRIHIRMGYGSNPLKYPISFSGTVTEMNTDDIITIVAQSDGLELCNNPISSDQNAVNNFTKLQSEPSNILASLLCDRDNWVLDKISNGKIFEKSKYGIEHFGLMFKDDPAGHTAQYDLCKNIYIGKYTSQLFINNSTFLNIPGADNESNINMSLYNRYPWDIMQTCVQFLPDFVCRPMYHQFESRIYYGLPHWIQKYEYKLEGNDIYEYAKTFSQFHYIDDLSDIIDNQIQVSSQNLKTNIISTYSLGGKTKTTPTLYADRSIDWGKQKIKIIDTTAVQDYIGPDWIYEKLGWDVAKTAAIRIGISNMLDSFNNIYNGSIIIIGDGSIKPCDHIYVSNPQFQMDGLCEVRSVVHNMSAETGFTTDITPGLCGGSMMQNSGIMNVYKTFNSIGLSMSVVKNIRLSEIQNMKIIRRAASVSIGVPLGALIIDYMSVRKNIFNNLFSSFKDGSLLDKFPNVIKNIFNIFKSASTAETAAATMTAVAGSEVTALATTDSTIEETAGLLGLAAGPVGSIIAMAVTTVLVNTVLTWVFDQFQWNNCIFTVPMNYKSKPFIAGVNGQTKLIPGFADSNNTYSNQNT